MKNQIKQLLLTLSVLALPALVQAQFTYTINGGAVTITGYNPAAGLNVVIPATIDGDSVTSIGDHAFLNQNITSVSIPASVTDIQGGAFQGCSSMTSVTIPYGVSSIGGAAFGECTSLTSLTLPASLTIIWNDAFYQCSGLTTVNIPASVTSIGVTAFNDCTSMTSITVDPANPAYSSLGGVLFDKAQATLVRFPGGLGGSYTIPGSVTSIGPDAFSATSLTSVTIPGSVTSIGGGRLSVAA